jgi:ribose transport system substrate-binding protein
MNDANVRARLDPPKVSSAADAGASGPKRKKYRVMVIPKGTTHVFWQSVRYGVNKAAEELGNVEVVWLAPIKEDDRLEQIALVQRAVAAKMDGIVIAPLDSQALAPHVDDAVDAGIPVLIMDSAIDSKKPIAYVATDNYHGGVLGAERLAELLGGEGRIILVRYAPNSEATVQREKGFLDTIKKYPKIEILSDDQYAGATAESAQQVAQRLVVRFQGRVDGIFTPNESSTAGTLRALLDAGMLRTTTQ